MAVLDTLQHLESSVSQDRLQKYLEAAQGSIEKAFVLYEKNIAVSESLYTPIQQLEICLRNKINNAIRANFGDDWLTAEDSFLYPIQKEMVREALKKLGAFDDDGNQLRELNEFTNGDIVAELKFSFWVALLSHRYDMVLWRSCLFGLFQNTSGAPRKVVFNRMNMIRRLRNRVMHHEPVIFSDPDNKYSEILEAIGWMCPSTREWTIRLSNYRKIEP